MSAQEPISCRGILPFENNPAAGDTFMFMPAGLQTIRASVEKKPATLNVLIDAAAARRLEQQREALVAAGRPPYFDFGHTNGPASFWPRAFFWSETPRPGVYVRGEWTKAGREGIEGREWRQFSPNFYVDDPKATPSRVICKANAPSNMGGLVNDPAFSDISPFFSRHAGAHEPGDNPPSIDPPSIDPQTNTNMTQEQIDALRARNTELEQQVSTLQAQAAADSKNELVAARLSAAQSELEANRLKTKNAELENTNATHTAAIAARNAADAKNAVSAAITRGAIPAKDTESVDHWTRIITADPANAKLLNALPGSAALGAPITPGAAVSASSAGTLGSFSVNARAGEVLKAFAVVCAKQAKVDPGFGVSAKAALAEEVRSFYNAELRGKDDMFAVPLSAAAVSAADSTDPNLGTLAGTLVAIKKLEDFKQRLLPTDIMTTDFSTEPAKFGQTTNTRIVILPAVMGYNPAPGADGRPIGYVVTQEAKTVDVDVTLDQHQAVEIVFNAQQLGGTIRDLFGEQENLQMYALALSVNQALLGNINTTNFPGAVASGNLPLALAPSQFGRGTFAKVNRIFNKMGLPEPGRFALVGSDYYEILQQDPKLNWLLINKNPEILTRAELPEISKIQPYECSYLPETDDLAAFFGHRSALVLQTRLPQDYTQALPGTAWGNVSVVTIDGGLSALITNYTDHKGAYAASRVAIMYGTAAGNPNSGLIIQSADEPAPTPPSGGTD